MTLMNSTRSELTKQFTTSIWWILAIVLVLYVGGTAAAIAGVFGATTSGVLPGETSGPTPPASALPGVVYSFATSVGYVFPLLVGTLMVTTEFRHKTLTPTFLATPRRGVALSGKLLAGVVVGLLFAVLAVVSTVLPGAALLAAFGIETNLGSSDTWALIGRMLVALVLWLLIGIGVGTLVRNQVVAVVGVLAFTQFVEPIARLAAGFVDGLGSVAQFFPGAASDALVGASIFNSLGGGASQAETVAWWAGGLVLLGYAVVLTAIGYLVSWRRDVA